MKKIDAAIEIVSSSNTLFSSMSQESRDSALIVLSNYYASVKITMINSVSDLENLVVRKPDLVFLGMNFMPAHQHLDLEDPNRIWLSEYFDENNIAYTGSGQIAHALERSKPMAKQRVLEAGLNTSRFFVAKKNHQYMPASVPIRFPVFIKPINRGGGLGIDSDSVAYNTIQLNSKTLSISTNFRADSLIEEYLPGREFSVAILKNEYSGQYEAMPIELIAQPDRRGVRMLSKKVKSSNAENVISVEDENLRDSVTNLALNVFNALGARDYGRIDIRMDKNNIPHFLEANLIPSLISGYGSFPKACMLNAGLNYEQMILQIVRLGLARSEVWQSNKSLSAFANEAVFSVLEPA